MSEKARPYTSADGHNALQNRYDFLHCQQVSRRYGLFPVGSVGSVGITHIPTVPTVPTVSTPSTVSTSVTNTQAVKCVSDENGYYTNTANTANTANACIPPTNANTQEGVSTVSSVSTVSTVSTVSSVSTVTPITQSECLSNSDTAPESVQSSPARDASEDWCWVPPKRKGLQWLVSTGEDSPPTPPQWATQCVPLRLCWQEASA